MKQKTDNNRIMQTIDELIRKGETFTFRNNSYTASHGTFSRPSSDLLSWITTVEDFIHTNYGEDSAPFKLFQTFNRKELNGYLQDDFEKQLSILIGALKACKSISPKPKYGGNKIIKFIESWNIGTTVTLIGLLISGLFTFGLYIGSAKFDKEKRDYYDLTKKQEIEINNLKKMIVSRDSTILTLEDYNTKLETDLATANDGRLLFYSKQKEYEDKMKESPNK